MHVVFYGTHDFAVTILQALIDNPEITVDLVITQPDRPVGRKKLLTPPPVKVLADQHGIEVLQPQSLKQFDLPRPFDLGVTAQYGLLIPERLLQHPTHQTLNVHTSLLPKYRGAAPIQAAILHGEHTTGVTIMQMDRGLDTGPTISAREVSIGDDETTPELEQRLAALGATLLIETIPRYTSGSLIPTPQTGPSSYAPILNRDDGRITWSHSTADIYNRYRALTPWPGIWTTKEGKRLKLLEITPGEEILSPGVLQIKHGTIHIGTGDGSIHVLVLQPEGKQPMTPQQFAQYAGAQTMTLR